MHKGDNPEVSGVAADATDALVAALSARLDALVASWELAIGAQRTAGAAASDVARREPADVLAELERELSGLERRCAEQREAVATEERAAVECESRAMASIRDGRDDIARQAIERHRDHADAAAAAAAEAAELEAVRDSYRNAVAAVRSTVEPGSG